MPRTYERASTPMMLVMGCAGATMLTLGLWALVGRHHDALLRVGGGGVLIGAAVMFVGIILTLHSQRRSQ